METQEVVFAAFAGYVELDMTKALEAMMTSVPTAVVDAASSTLVGETICVEKVLSVARSTVEVGTRSE